MKFLLKVLDFCNVLDYSKRLSITNIALIVLLAKVAFASPIDWPSIVSLVIAFSNYAHKRSSNQVAVGVNVDSIRQTDSITIPSQT